MRARRGVALLAALWLVVAIALVALQFSLDAKERRILGVNASERGIERAAATGALALMEGRLDYALRIAPTGNAVSVLRASDPWLDVDSLYSGTYLIDSLPVEVHARDLGTMLNINVANVDELRTFFNFVLKDYDTSDRLAQTMVDWRDVDDMPQPHGAEKDDYLKAGLLTLPANGPFRDVTDMLALKGMTPEIYASIAPYLTTRGAGTINLNSAPPPVLRTLPGMTDVILAQVLNLRSQGRRISSVNQVLAAATRGRPLNAVQQGGVTRTTQQIAARATVNTNEVELTIVSRMASQAQPARLLAIVQRTGTTANIEWKQW